MREKHTANDCVRQKLANYREMSHFILITIAWFITLKKEL